MTSQLEQLQDQPIQAEARLLLHVVRGSTPLDDRLQCPSMLVDHGLDVGDQAEVA